MPLLICSADYVTPPRFPSKRPFPLPIAIVALTEKLVSVLLPTFTMPFFRLSVLSFLLVHGAQTFSPAAIPFAVRTPYLNAWQTSSADSTNQFPFFWNNTVREHYTSELHALTSQHRRTSAGYATFGSTTRHIRFGVTRVLMQSRRIELLKQAYYPRPSLLRHAQYKS